MLFRRLRSPLSLPLVAAVLLLGRSGDAADLPLPSPSAADPGAAPVEAPAAGSPTPSLSPSAREQQVLERIRRLKTPRWREFGVCRYDWGGWRLSEAGVRATTAECGEPALSSGVAVHCDTLRVARRSGDGPWEPWRLPLASDESKTLGGEDRMVASLCANVSSPPAPPAGKAGTAPPLKAPPTAPAAGASLSKPRPKTP